VIERVCLYRAQKADIVGARGDMRKVIGKRRSAPAGRTDCRGLPITAAFGSQTPTSDPS
jgi:hypothetical protein